MHEHNPQISVWPVAVALSITLIVIGMISLWYVSLLGIALLLYSIYSWTQENRIIDGVIDQGVEMEVREIHHE